MAATSHAADPSPEAALPAQDEDGHPGLAALRARGAHRFDPAGFRFIEALAHRMRHRDGAVGRLLEQRLIQALAAYGARYDAAVAELDKAVPLWVTQYPQAAQALRQLHGDGDVLAVRRFVARLQAQSRSRPMADLVRLLDGHPGAQASAAAGGTGAAAAPVAAVPLAELKTVQRFRDTWSRMRMDDQLSQSRRSGPENPGPLNSHLLVLRALQRMQELAPAYLERFMAHADALMWLEGADVRKPPGPVKTEPRGRDRRKGKAGTGRAG